MPSIRITSFGGMNTEIAARLSQDTVAQIAHNCLLWDGTLRPLAKWVKRQGVAFADVASIQLTAGNDNILASGLKETVFLDGANYIPNTTLGLRPYYYSNFDSNLVYVNRLTLADGKGVGVRRPILDNSTTISYDRQYHSDKPVNRVYAVSAVRKLDSKTEESTISLLPNQTPSGIIYEGDTATINVHAQALVPYEYTGLRLYRSISGMDTGAAVANEIDTEWFLIAELNGGTTDGINYDYVYVDGGAASTDPLDLYLAGGFYAPRRFLYSHLQLLEGGWVAAVTDDGDISFSERYLYHAWPVENYFKIHGQKITACKAQFDNLFIGTQNQPYVVAVATGEKLGLQAAVTPFPEVYPCLPNTMDKTPSGAMYASPSGVVSLTREGMKLLSAGATSGVRALYKIERHYETTVAGVTTKHTQFHPMRYQDTAYAAYYRGTFFGFCRVNTYTSELVDGFLTPLFLFKGYMFETGSSIDGEHPMQRFVTMDTPNNVRAHTSGGSGLYVLATDGVYQMAFPDSIGNEMYGNAAKYCYSWKSKKFVFPGQMVMAAAKVVHDCKGFVRLKIMVDCCCLYETLVHDCKPFTLPPNLAGVEWEVELEGNATVHEVHLASSLRELIEHE